MTFIPFLSGADTLQRWVDRLPTPLAIIAIGVGSFVAVALVSCVAGGLMWGAYWLGWEDMRPDLWVQELFKEAGYLPK